MRGGAAEQKWRWGSIVPCLTGRPGRELNAEMLLFLNSFSDEYKQEGSKPQLPADDPDNAKPDDNCPGEDSTSLMTTAQVRTQLLGHIAKPHLPFGFLYLQSTLLLLRTQLSLKIRSMLPS